MNNLSGLMPSLTAHMRREPKINVDGTLAVKAVPAETAQQKHARIMADYDRIPEVWRVSASNVITAAGSLAWDYADTVCDECISLCLPFKKEVRTVRKLHSRFIRPMQYIFDREQRAKAEDWGLGVEEACKDHLNAVNMLAVNTARTHGLRERETFVSAVFQCLVVTVAVMSYAKLTDNTIREVFGIPTPADHMLLPVELEYLNGYLSKFVPHDVFEAMRPHLRTAAKTMTEVLIGAEKVAMDELSRIKFRRWTRAEEDFARRSKGRYTPAQACYFTCRSEKAFTKKQNELTQTQKKK